MLQCVGWCELGTGLSGALRRRPVFIDFDPQFTAYPPHISSLRRKSDNTMQHDETTSHATCPAAWRTEPGGGGYPASKRRRRGGGVGAAGYPDGSDGGQDGPDAASRGDQTVHQPCLRTVAVEGTCTFCLPRVGVYVCAVYEL